MTRTPFEAMAAMAEANGDIMSTNQFVRGQNTKRGDELTMGMVEGQLAKIASGKYITCLFVINADEFEQFKNGTEAK